MAMVGTGNSAARMDLSGDIKETSERLADILRQITMVKVFSAKSDLKRGLESSIVTGNLERGIMDYIVASVVLSFACQDIDEESLGRLLYAMGKSPQQDLIMGMHRLHYSNNNPYINTIYYLKGLGAEPSIDLMISLLRAMDVKPDVFVARRVMEFCDNIHSGKTSTDVEPPEGPMRDTYLKLAAMIDKLYNTTLAFMLNEKDRILQHKSVESYPVANITPYVATIGLLSLTGKDVDGTGILRILESIGVEAQETVLKAINTIHVRNHSVYLASVAFLATQSGKVTRDGIVHIVRALGIKPDIQIAESILDFYNSTYKNE